MRRTFAQKQTKAGRIVNEIAKELVEVQLTVSLFDLLYCGNGGHVESKMGGFLLLFKEAVG